MMKATFRVGVRYQFGETLRAMIALYAAEAVLIAVNLLIWKGVSYTPEAFSLLFLFVIGACACGDNLRLSVVNGVSRRTTALSVWTSLALASAVTAFINALIPFASGLLGEDFLPLYTHLYGGRFARAGAAFAYTAAVAAENFVWQTAGCLLAAVLGLFFAALFYRMKNWMKVAFCVGVPLFALWALPSLDALLFGGGTLRRLGWLGLRLMGFDARLGAGGIVPGANPPSPYPAALTFAAASAATAAATWALIRRAPIRPRDK